MARKAGYRVAAADGFSVVELMVAILILVVGIFSTFAVFDTSKRATHVSETQEGEIHVAQQELERLQTLAYTRLGLTGAPGPDSNPNSPNYYVTATPSSSCPTFRWNQSAGASNTSDQLVVNGCAYPGINPNPFSGGTVPLTQTISGYTVYDYVTWVNDNLCRPGYGCLGDAVTGLGNYDYKRVTVEVTNSQSAAYGPTTPVLVSSIVSDPHATPVVGNPNINNPLNTTNVTCTDGSGHTVTCNNGLGSQTPNVFYLTDSLEQNGYTPPSADNSCMHYTVQKVPLAGGQLSCGGVNLGACTSSSIVGCPQPDLLNGAPPASSIPQEFNFSPNISSTTPGRVILRDPNASTCASTPSPDATMGEFWGTQPLTSALNLSGNGAMTLYTNTLHGLSVSVTLCVGVYLEAPVLGILDPLNLLGNNDSITLGVVAYTLSQWPAAPTPLSFTFNYMSAARLAAAGASLGVRIWVTASSGDDIVAHYDAPSVSSRVQINSQ
jgi:hypothetical protein